MGVRIIREGHTCDTPPADRHAPGTIAQCDCGRYWQLKPADIAPGQRPRWIELGLIDRIRLGLADSAAASQRQQQIEDDGQ